MLPILAALQYRWLGQVSENERARLQRALLNAMGAVARDIDTEVSSAVGKLNIDRLVASRTAPGDGPAGRRAVADAPRLVRDVLRVERSGGEDARLWIRRCDVGTAVCSASEWPAALADLQQRLARELRRGSTDDIEDLSRTVRSAGPGQSVIVIPARRNRADQERRQRDKDDRGGRDDDRRARATLVLLDDQWLRTELLPSIVARHFGPSRESEFHVAIVHRDSPLDVVYGDPSAPLAEVIARPEAWQELFTLRPDGFSDRRSSDEGGLSSGDRHRPTLGRDEDDDEEWMLVARHRDGSLQTAIDNLRRRNLAISSGMLALVGVAVGLIAVTSRRAQRLADQQIEFVAGVSHELRTPVSAIHLAAQNLADGTVSDPSRIRRYGATIHLESQRLRATVERVLQFASISAGGAIGPQSIVDIRALVEGAAASAREEHPGAEIAVTGPAETPTIVGDPVALHACVQNVLANALKYGGPAPRVEIALTTETRRGAPELRLSVTDHGPGIPPGDLTHIFKPFFRGRNAIAQRIQGNGLGLHLVRRFVAAHGGRVDVQSAVGRGSTFLIHLPLRSRETPTSRS